MRFYSIITNLKLIANHLRAKPQQIRRAFSINTCNLKTMELQVGVMNYEWGKIGNSSEVARLYKNNENITINEQQPYAELWMGTHKNCPSFIKSNGMELNCFLQNHAGCLGDASVKMFGKDLPFLFKVLSVNKALSIQVHPNKEHAEKLHLDSPDLYKDPNHKPELAIALTEFKAMCGFRPFQEIQSNLKAIPEVESLITKDSYAKFLSLVDQKAADDILPECFKFLMQSTSEATQAALNAIVQRYEAKQNISEEHQDLFALIVKLNQQFPNDIGCFGPVFLNVLTLSPGQAIFLGANEIHAYLEGDCVECMASSDNVVRAGLTPKFKDVDTLCKMLNYKGAVASSKLFDPSLENEYTKVFRPPVPDFAVAVTKIPKNVCTRLVTRTVASIVIFVKGYAHTHDNIICSEGTVLFIPANEELQIVDVKEDVTCYIGMANV